MLPTFAKDTVIRIRPGTITRRGSTEPDWSTADQLTISGCSVQPTSTSLSQDGRVLGIDDRVTCYLPPGSDVQSGDRILFDGNYYTIDGDPLVWRSPSGRVSNIQLNLERWAG